MLEAIATKEAAVHNNSNTVKITGNYAIVIERQITRQFDENGELRNEFTEERTRVIPTTPVLASQMRSLSSQSFVPYEQPAQLSSTTELDRTINNIKGILGEIVAVKSLPNGRL